MRIRHVVSMMVVIAAALRVAWAQGMPAKVEVGEIRLRKADSTEWTSVTDAFELAVGDSLDLAGTASATVGVAGVGQLLLKDSSVVVWGTAEDGTVAELVKGQLFLVREDAADSLPVCVVSKGCKFLPVGTAAAFKLIRAGDPSVAVLRGSIRMESPGGATQDVGAGMFSTFVVASGALSPVKELPSQAVAALESWSGVTLAAGVTPEAPVTEEAPVSTDVVSQDAAGAPAEAAVAPVAEVPEAPAEARPEGEKSTEEQQQEEEKEEAEGKEGEAEKPKWEVSAGAVTVDDEQWTRIAVGVDVPVWRFGIFFDIEIFLNARGEFSNKGWEFSKDAWAETLFRKIRYIRLNHKGDPVYARFGGLDNVTFVYGLVVDRFCNTLHYPGEKLLGLQFDLNDISPIGITLQTLIADFHGFGNNGGVVAARLAFKPFKATEKPVIGGLSLGAMIASDINQYAPARDWDFTLHGDRWDEDEDGTTDSSYLYGEYGQESGFYDSIVNHHRGVDDYDATTEHQDEWASTKHEPISILGGDLIVPIVETKVVQLNLYGQLGVTLADGEDDLYKGWGISAPGVHLKAGPFWSRLEYRRVVDQFIPGYFGTYYLDERLRRNPVTTKEERLAELEGETLNGVFGLLGFNIADMIILSGAYQRLVAEDDSDLLDQRFEAKLALGDKIVGAIPKINKVEAFLEKQNIQHFKMSEKADGTPVYDDFFQKTPDLYWGYRLGGEMLPGASIIWETRYGWEMVDGELVENNTVNISAGLSF